MPLARLEGIVALVAWAITLGREQRRAHWPLLGAAVAWWAFAGWLRSGDPLWLLHANPYGVLGSRYAAAGWTYVFRALLEAAGSIVIALGVLGLPGRDDDRHTFRLAIALLTFYAVAWGLPAFQTIGDPVYLVSTSVPVALLAHRGIVRLARIERWGPAVAALTLAASVVVCTARVRPFPMRNGAVLARQLAASLGARRGDVALWTDPAFAWYVRSPPPRYRDPFAVPSGKLVVWDSRFGPRLMRVDEEAMRNVGFRPLEERRRGRIRMVVFER